LKSRGKIINFRESGGKCTKTGRQNRGEIRNLWSMTKKRSSEILADENDKYFTFDIFQKV